MYSDCNDATWVFWEATFNGKYLEAQALCLDPEVDLNFQNHAGLTAFHCACRSGHMGMIRYLLDFIDASPRRRRVDFNLTDEEGESSLGLICLKGCQKSARMLLDDQRIEVDGVNRHQQSPFWIACFWGHVGVVRAMLASGRRFDKRRKDSRYHLTALEAAKLGNHESIVGLLQSFEEDPARVWRQLRKESGYSDGELFALVVYFSDGYLAIPCISQEEDNIDLNDREQRSKSLRFFSISSRLPMELQMILCIRVFGEGKAMIKRIHSELGFRKFAKGLC